MKHVEYVNTFGMGEGELNELLRTRRVGVLALADAGDAYAVPVAYDYDGESLLVRLDSRDESAKIEHLETTGTATFVLYDAETPSWSVIVRGPLREREGFDETRVDERFPDIRVFGEEIDEMEAVVYELEMDEVTGRRAE
ncbi:pyridoxamine 5'-phosphate oxidase family protein [Halorussus salilacus]|uniref:pyridoxamine 5'-phosphate oxidase family protein n=1 Tax=Halorussus salilacus TaxID=2953750 RepID=UPI0020A18A7B|nr:pyridoxamine 5'-phosphate oxidase family protein [Halorussus salilacus]USZ67491.1 pyridoxamine 5'-phosphate oxidase family protein [Halorussus salilacus]